MIKYFKSIPLILILICSFEVARSQQLTNPDSLLQHKQFFVLRDVINKPAKAITEFERAYFTAFIDNFFNKPVQSNTGIALLQSKYAGKLPVAKRIALLKLQQDNDVKLFDYKAAYEHTRQLLTDFDKQLTKDDKEDAENSIIIWKNLITVQKQQTLIQKDTRIATTRDMARLMTIPVTFGAYQDAYIFDTGANISVITESNAKKAQLQMVGDTFQVDAITGIKIKARTGVSSELKIGDLVVRKVVFLVFPDSALSFAGGKYKIQGIIGFPVIASMNEVRINKAGYMDIPAKSTVMPVHNFGLDGLTPVVNLDYKGTMLPFTFDTGAQVTQLNKSFYDLYRQDIHGQGVAGEIKMGGAGGANSLKGYKLPTVSFKLYDKMMDLTDIHVKTATTIANDNYYFGNLGQDAFGKFDELLINFEHMYVMLINTK
jgi:predicted HAD superfamily phosphohydrolase YqeG